MNKQIVKVITLGEPGGENHAVRVRYTDFGSAILMCAFLFRGRCRYGIKILSEAEQQAYRDSRAVVDCGEGI